MTYDLESMKKQQQQQQQTNPDWIKNKKTEI